MNLQHERIAGLCMQLKLDCVARCCAQSNTEPLRAK